ncbi:hypothetical protein [Mesorhizobium sp.]|uniref:hypothetical protein n=1 Tax=Mesorhizobium sp. TaxID=1871066 RepID=UPI000FE755CD|nr:hypothetical protein [Mesorhizobium sp.]RWI35389.1 MAG: hypothetical protein EOR14_28205 [Mesorhizobium sp.]RWJ66442.1 MAG: hypothetical protein EOR34_28930 [Mesorhizobium sp.]
MSFNLTLDRAYKAQRKTSVLYRAGYRAGLAGTRPNKWSMDQDFYVQGYRAGVFRREVNIAAGIGAIVVVTALLTAVALGF